MDFANRRLLGVVMTRILPRLFFLLLVSTAVLGTENQIHKVLIRDVTRLEGGMLLLTPLYAADGQVFAAAQGPLVVGGYTAGGAANSKQMNHPTVGRVPGGALVERDSSLDLAGLDHVSLLLNEASFTTAEEVALVINHDNHDSTQPLAT